MPYAPLRVENAVLLEDLGDDRHGRVDGVRDDEHERLGGVLGDARSEVAHDACVDLETVLASGVRAISAHRAP